nr:hypothetical protein CFP56_19699 [Quercus suber]
MGHKHSYCTKGSLSVLQLRTKRTIFAGTSSFSGLPMHKGLIYLKGLESNVYDGEEFVNGKAYSAVNSQGKWALLTKSKSLTITKLHIDFNLYPWCVSTRVEPSCIYNFTKTVRMLISTT